MSSAFLIILLTATVAYKVMLKNCSLSLEHKSVPIFISSWVLIGLIVTAPFFTPLWQESLSACQNHPYLIALALVKSGLLYLSITTTQELMKHSLSSTLYVAPMAIGLSAIANFFLGERLIALQWFSVLSVCALSGFFFFRGHLQELSTTSKRHYLLNVFLFVCMASLDQFMIPLVNWYGYLSLSNIGIFSIGLWMVRGDWKVIKRAIFSKLAILTGCTFMVVELLKFYQSITINPITAVNLTQNMASPILLALSALIWRERTLKEQLIWGVSALVLSLPLILS